VSRELTANSQQFDELLKLVDQLGVGVYRDAKRAAGLAWHTPFRRLYQLEANTVIGIMREKLNEKGKHESA
jgi:hypothetical protein